MEILAAGGNAFDAAVAVSAMLGLVEPESSGIGGGGFILLHVPATAARCSSTPASARRWPPARHVPRCEDGEPVRGRSVNGALAAAIPGLPAGLEHLATRYGRLPLAQSLAPAIRAAREGWTFGPKNAGMLGFRRDVLAPIRARRAVPGRRQGAGSRRRAAQSGLRRDARAPGRRGRRGFYRGEFAAKLVDGVRAAGGIWTLEDLAATAWSSASRWCRTPRLAPHRHRAAAVLGRHRAGDRCFNVLDGLRLSRPALSRVDRIHLLTEAMRRAYRDRALYLGDPDFVDVPVARWPARLRRRPARRHPSARATPSDLLPGVGPPSEDTTHFSIIDAEGNLVAVTQTVNLPYGNGLVVPGHRLPAQQRDGRFLGQARRAQRLRPGRRGRQRDRAGQAPAVVDDADLLFGPSASPCSARRAAAASSPWCCSACCWSDRRRRRAGRRRAPRFHHQYLPDALSAEPGTPSAPRRSPRSRRGSRRFCRRAHLGQHAGGAVAPRDRPRRGRHRSALEGRRQGQHRRRFGDLPLTGSPPLGEARRIGA
jgi:gamma-glutamyltranspeptidase / glutathione hydrolase